MHGPCLLTRGTGPLANCTGRQRPSASRSTQASLAASLFSSASSVYLRQLEQSALTLLWWLWQACASEQELLAAKSFQGF